MPPHDPMGYDGKQVPQNGVQQLAREADEVAAMCEYLMHVAVRIKTSREVIGDDDAALQMELGERHAEARRQLDSIQKRLNTSARANRPVRSSSGRPPAGRGGRPVVDSRSRGRTGSSGFP